MKELYGTYGLKDGSKFTGLDGEQYFMVRGKDGWEYSYDNFNLPIPSEKVTETYDSYAQSGAWKRLE